MRNIDFVELGFVKTLPYFKKAMVYAAVGFGNIE